MKIGKAIKLTEYLFKRRPQLIDPDHDAAIKLGLEALKCIQKLRPLGYVDTDELLPGETEE